MAAPAAHHAAPGADAAAAAPAVPAAPAAAAAGGGGAGAGAGAAGAAAALVAPPPVGIYCGPLVQGAGAGRRIYSEYMFLRRVAPGEPRYIYHLEGVIGAHNVGAARFRGIFDARYGTMTIQSYSTIAGAILVPARYRGDLLWEAAGPRFVGRWEDVARVDDVGVSGDMWLQYVGDRGDVVGIVGGGLFPAAPAEPADAAE